MMFCQYSFFMISSGIRVSTQWASVSLTFLAFSTIRCIRWVGVGRDAGYVGRSIDLLDGVPENRQEPRVVIGLPVAFHQLAFHRLCVDVKNHPLSRLRFQLDGGHDRCQQLYGGDLRLARFPLLEELFRDNLRGVVGLVLVLSRSPGRMRSIQTWAVSGIWSCPVTPDDNVRWGPVAGVSNGPSAVLSILQYPEPHVRCPWEVQRKTRPTWM